MDEEYRSGLPEDEVDELARNIMRIICDERPGRIPDPESPSSTTRCGLSWS